MQLRSHTTLLSCVSVLSLVLGTCSTNAQLPTPTPSGSTPQERFFPTIASAAPHETKPAGGMGGTPFKEIFPEGGILVGLDVWCGNYGNAEVVCGLSPIYQTQSGRHRGKFYGNKTGSMMTLEARDGYAVAGVRAVAGGVVESLQLQFQQIDYKTFKLTSVDPYKSDVAGGKSRKSRANPTLILPGTKPISGIFGSCAMCIDRIGLIYADRKE